MPNFICPKCGDRSVATERTAGFVNRARDCKKCGFNFLFELLDDYYPAPTAAFFLCDQNARPTGAVRGARALTRLGDAEAAARSGQGVPGLEGEGGRGPRGTAPD